MNLNKVILVGRLTQDPQIRTTSSGQSVCSFGLATNRVWTNQTTNQREEKTDFHNIVLWGKLAEISSQYLKKGNLLLVEGRIQNRSWQDSSGNKRYKTEIIAENIQLPPKSMTPQTITPQTSNKFSQQENIPIIEEGKDEEKPSSAEKPQANLTTNHPSEDDEEIDIEKIPF